MKYNTRSAAIGGTKNINIEKNSDVCQGINCTSKLIIFETFIKIIIRCFCAYFNGDIQNKTSLLIFKRAVRVLIHAIWGLYRLFISSTYFEKGQIEKMRKKASGSGRRLFRLLSAAAAAGTVPAAAAAALVPEGGP